MSRWIEADALIAELQKDEERFDKEAEDCRKNSRNYTDCYMQAMSSRADGIRDAIVEVYDAPSIEPKREWIPCSERLPEERLIVLVSFEEIYGLLSIGITYYNNGKWEGALYREVTAWMPLPKPYEEGE